MRHALQTSLRLLLVFTAITGLAYPLGVTLAAHLFFPARAEGSLVRVGGRTVGSTLIGQSFADPRYFWGRPSATTPPYNAAASSGSNLGPSNPALADSIRARVERLRRSVPPNARRVPVDLVTASASGLDPDISPAAAYYQVPRVARARGRDEASVRALVARCLQPRQWGVLGEPRVNMLKLNLALDAQGESR